MASFAVSCFVSGEQSRAVVGTHETEMLWTEVVEMVLVLAVVEGRHICQVLATLQELLMMAETHSSDRTASVEAAVGNLRQIAVLLRLAIVQRAVGDGAAVAAALKQCSEAEMESAAWT